METIEDLKQKVEVLQLKIKIQELEAELSQREAMNRPTLSSPWCSDYQPPRYKPVLPASSDVFYKSSSIGDC